MKNDFEKPEVLFFQRKPRTVGNYSVEFIFKDVRNRLKDEIQATVIESPYESSGFLKRLLNCIDAYIKQGEVNHVTGDINYVGLLLKPRNTIHTILDCVYLNTSSRLKYKLLKLFWLSIPEKRSRFLTAISESTKREILKHHACNPDKIIVIPVAISEGFVYSYKDFDAHSPRILQIGTAPNKNIPNLIEALKGINCLLHIVGKKVELYEELLKKNSINYVYEWDLTAQEIKDRYERADIISLVSTYEGFGMPILEAQATGRPVITSTLFSMPEVAGDAACLADPNDVQQIKSGILKIINDKLYRDELVKRGLENCKRYSPETIAQQYLQLYKKIAFESN